MGQKVNPHGLRVGIIKGWDTQWYADKKEFGAFLKEDYDIRKYVKDTYFAAAISKVTIERAAGKVAVTIYTARPGVLIGKAGAEIEVMKKKLAKITNGKPVSVNIFEVKKPELDANIVANNIARQVEGKIAYRRAIKMAVQNTMRAGAEGIKVQICGRLNGAEMARKEMYKEGRTPLHTLRSDIDYCQAEALTKVGLLGIKVWICKGEVYGKRDLTVNFAQEKQNGGRNNNNNGRRDRGNRRRNNNR